MHNDNIFQLFQSRFPSDRNAVFLAHARGELTFGELETASGRMLTLLHELGVKKGDRILVQVDKSAEAIILYLASLRAGAIFVPLNTAYTADEVAYFIGDASPILVVCRPQDKAELAQRGAAEGVPHVHTLDDRGGGSLMEGLNDRPASRHVATCAEAELACILYTSGTTGRSKGAMLSHGNLSSNAKVLHEYWRWRPGDVLLHALPIFHVHGLFVALHCALMNASKVVFLASFSLPEIKKSLPHVTVMMGVPTFYVRLLDDPQFNRDMCRNMRLFVAGSAPLLPETFTEFEDRTGHAILERYGMTEAGMITSNPYDGDRVPGTVGFALPGVSTRVVDSDGREVATGEVGVLEIAGPNVFKGYWRMPKKTAEEFRADGYFITGDMATKDENGRIAIVGRARDVVISGGYNVYPREVEMAIDDIVGVKESAVIGVPHPDFGEGVAAVVVPDGDTNLTQEDVVGALQTTLARFKQPKRVFFVSQLPRNTMGKVQKKELRERYNSIFTD